MAGTIRDCLPHLFFSLSSTLSSLDDATVLLPYLCFVDIDQPPNSHYDVGVHRGNVVNS